jgi:hypothetical protein
MSEFIFQEFFIINLMKIMNRKYDISVIMRIIDAGMGLFFYSGGRAGDIKYIMKLRYELIRTEK